MALLNEINGKRMSCRCQSITLLCHDMRYKIRNEEHLCYTDNALCVCEKHFWIWMYFKIMKELTRSITCEYHENVNSMFRNQTSNFQTQIKDRYLAYFLWYCPSVNATRHRWWLVNTGLGNGLVPLGNKPLPEPILTQICIVIWRI